MSKTITSAGAFSHRTRAGYLDRFRQETFDLVIIGGGITGAGIARDAAMRGLSVALLEKGDFAAGTSSRSSKMIHGGLRYLKHLQVRLVRESLREREVLLKTASYLVHPFPYILPVYEGGPNSTPTVDGGRVYTLSRRGHVFCLDAAKGTRLWNMRLAIKPPTWGLAGSPLVQGIDAGIS